MLPSVCVAMKYLTVNPADWDRLLDERRTFEDNQYAVSTACTRNAQVKSYLEFCEVFADRIKPYPCSVDQICLYATYLARRLCYSSIRNYVSAVNNHFKDLGFEPVDYENHCFKKCMLGIRRLKGDAVKQAAPILPHLLKKLFVQLRQTEAHTAVRAAMLMSFRGLLRKGHVTNSDVALLRSDVVVHVWGMMLHIKKSKTNQFRQRMHLIPISRVKNKELCAVHWYEVHVQQCPAHADAIAFRMPRRGHSVPLSYKYYQAVIKNACSVTGLDASEFSTHSLRRGGATFLRMCGASIQDIMERGDWKSDAVFQYLALSVEERLARDMRVALHLA